MQPYRRFNPQYRERLRLAEGTWVELRLVRPEDGALLREGFERLSPRSRYQRFLGARPRLSEEEVRYLTWVDGEAHFALGAVTWGPDGREVGLGVARFIRLPGRPEVAELAVTVVDEAQGKGLGGLLVRRLVEAARERGLERLECRVLPFNRQMYRMLRALTPCEPEKDEDALCFTVPLSAPPRGGGELLGSLLALAAQGALTLLGPTFRWRVLPCATPPSGLEEARS
ncbi:MAG TPA: GNAT family N-acetyltransferase [Myxococcaceae bacterium]|nr:GNAT family N-acetyltransferase [Myxococcaceae bacterium]